MRMLCRNLFPGILPYRKVDKRDAHLTSDRFLFYFVRIVTIQF